MRYELILNKKVNVAIMSLLAGKFKPTKLIHCCITPARFVLIGEGYDFLFCLELLTILDEVGTISRAKGMGGWRQ